MKRFIPVAVVVVFICIAWRWSKYDHWMEVRTQYGYVWEHSNQFWDEHRDKDQSWLKSVSVWRNHNERYVSFFVPLDTRWYVHPWKDGEDFLRKAAYMPGAGTGGTGGTGPGGGTGGTGPAGGTGGTGPVGGTGGTGAPGTGGTGGTGGVGGTGGTGPAGGTGGTGAVGGTGGTGASVTGGTGGTGGVGGTGGTGPAGGTGGTGGVGPAGGTGGTGAVGTAGAAGGTGASGPFNVAWGGNAVALVQVFGTNFIPAHGHAAVATSIETGVDLPFPVAGHVVAMYCKVSVAGGTNRTDTFALMINGAAAAITVTITNTATTVATATSTGAGVAINAGDFLAIRDVTAHAATATNATMVARSGGCSLLVGP